MTTGMTLRSCVLWSKKRLRKQSFVQRRQGHLMRTHPSASQACVASKIIQRRCEVVCLTRLSVGNQERRETMCQCIPSSMMQIACNFILHERVASFSVSQQVFSSILFSTSLFFLISTECPIHFSLQRKSRHKSVHKTIQTKMLIAIFLDFWLNNDQNVAYLYEYEETRKQGAWIPQQMTPIMTRLSMPIIVLHQQK